MLNLLEAVEIDPADVEEIWDLYLDGASISYISQNKVDLPVRTIKKVLVGPMPEKFKNDPRLSPYAYSCIPVSEQGQTAIGKEALKLPDGTYAVMVFFKYPRRKNTRKMWQKAQSELNKRFSIRLSNPFNDEIENEVAIKFIDQKGYPGFEIAEDGTVTRL